MRVLMTLVGVFNASLVVQVGIGVIFVVARIHALAMVDVLFERFISETGDLRAGLVNEDFTLVEV